MNIPDRIHYLGDDISYASIGHSIYFSKNFGKSWKLLAQLPVKLESSLISYSKLLSRLFRSGIHFIHPILNDQIIIFFHNYIYNYNLKTNQFTLAKSKKRKRPLSICVLKNSNIIYGEYNNNPDRDPVHVWLSKDGGISWSVIYKFNNIRHIHGVFHDPYTDKIWITTGDSDSESIIWRTDEHFNKLEYIIGGNQLCRAVQLLFTENCIYYGTDTPLEQNYICRIDRKTNKLEKVHKVDSSVFWGCKVNNHLFLSTTIEPSKVNLTKYACIWGSKNGEKWKSVARFKKDVWPKRLFQYGQVFFPSGVNKTNYFWFTPFACKINFVSQKMHLSDLFE